MTFFTKRYAPEPEPVVTPASVTITGTGDATDCYATINGTKYSTAGSNISVMPSDMITFGVYGSTSQFCGIVTIDVNQVLFVNDKTTKTYNWTVPDGVKTISIKFDYDSFYYTKQGRITVTTTK